MDSRVHLLGGGGNLQFHTGFTICHRYNPHHHYVHKALVVYLAAAFEADAFQIYKHGRHTSLMSTALVINDETSGAVFNSFSSFYGTGLTQWLHILRQSAMYEFTVSWAVA